MSYHEKIINTPQPIIPDKVSAKYSTETLQAYRNGHRDGRHAAAEIANEADAEIDALNAELDRAFQRIDALKAQLEVGNLCFDHVQKFLKALSTDCVDEGLERIAALKAQLAEARRLLKASERVRAQQIEQAEARADAAEKNFKALCQQTDQRESAVSDQFTLLDKARLEAEARADAAEKKIGNYSTLWRGMTEIEAKHLAALLAAEAKLEGMRKAINHALSDLESISDLTDDLCIDEIATVIANRLSAALDGGKDEQYAETA